MTSDVIEITEHKGKNFSVEFFSGFKLFLLIAPWIIMGLGMLCFALPLLQALHGNGSFVENLFKSKEIFFWIPGFILDFSAVVFLIFRSDCKDFILFDFEENEITLNWVFKNKVYQRILGTADDVYALSLDGEISSGKNSTATYYWGCLILNSGKTVQITQKVQSDKRDECFQKCEEIAQRLECEFINCIEELPIMVLEVQTYGKINIIHKEKHSFLEEAKKFLSMLIPVFLFAISVIIAGIVFKKLVY